ncbi:MAG: RHS repeat-associated core domain-containing protein, partial [Pseudodesulfovibrio sp.]
GSHQRYFETYILLTEPRNLPNFLSPLRGGGVRFRDGRLVEAYAWRDLIRLAGYSDGQREYEFAYLNSERTPYAMRRDDGAVFALHFDQVGSLRVVADEDGNVIKEVQYDPFGNIMADTNPAQRIPIGFAGGLHDRDLGFVRFGWRDYDTYTGRWTAPDPMGEAGGDPDWYGYCLDDPVNGEDPLGLFPLAGLVNMGGQLLQYAPAINSAVNAVANDVMDGSPGYGDALSGSAQWYADTVKDNVRQLKETRNAYYEDKRRESDDDQAKNAQSPEAAGRDWWGR